MPLRLDVKRLLSCRSERVKCCDLHPSQPWVLFSLYNGQLLLWNYESEQLVKTFEICDMPVRSARFVERKSWIVTGSDDMQIRIFNYNTMEKVDAFDAHTDYIRSLAIHPTQPFILSSSDDMTVKMWNWEKNWQCVQTFEGHSHYVMQIVINPKDNNTFATASLDKTVKVWQLGSPVPNFTLEGHEKGVNCIEYYHAADKPYLISGGDDALVKIWDYQNKSCVQTLTGHARNISAVAFHPELPIALSGSEDGTVRIWHANTHRLESTLNYGMERVWSIACMRGSNTVAIGYDEGSIVIKLGREEPAVSMDVGGKIVWSKHTEIQQANLKALGPDTEIQDGERLPIQVKDMGSCEVYPQSLKHSPNGRFVAVCGDGEYIIYTAMALRNKSFGAAQEFIWAADSSQYAVRESSSAVKLFKNFKEREILRPDLGCEALFGGQLLGVRHSGCLSFYDWDALMLVRRIEIQPKQVFWSTNGELVAICTESSYYILRYKSHMFTQAQADPSRFTEDGVEDAFDALNEVAEVVKTGIWVGDCFIYTNAASRLNYYVGGEIVTISHIDRPLYLLGYIAKDNRIYLCDKDLQVVSYHLLRAVLEYQTAVMRGDLQVADKLLEQVPTDHRTRVAHFLDKQGFKKTALAVSTDPEHRFDLACQLSQTLPAQSAELREILKLAFDIAKQVSSAQKWKQLANLCVSKCDFQRAMECLMHAEDHTGLLLLASATGQRSIVERVAARARQQKIYNVAFLAYWMLRRLEDCLDILIVSQRLPEAALFAHTYLPTQVSRVVQLWRRQAQKLGQEKLSQAIADPEKYDNLFGGERFQQALKAEQFYAVTERDTVPGTNGSNNNFGRFGIRNVVERNLVAEMTEAENEGRFQYEPGLVTSRRQQPNALGSVAAQSSSQRSANLLQNGFANNNTAAAQPGFLVDVGDDDEEANNYRTILDTDSSDHINIDNQMDVLSPTLVSSSASIERPSAGAGFINNNNNAEAAANKAPNLQPNSGAQSQQRSAFEMDDIRAGLNSLNSTGSSHSSSYVKLDINNDAASQGTSSYASVGVSGANGVSSTPSSHSGNNVPPRSDLLDDDDDDDADDDDENFTANFNRHTASAAPSSSVAAARSHTTANVQHQKARANNSDDDDEDDEDDDLDEEVDRINKRAADNRGSFLAGQSNVASSLGIAEVGRRGVSPLTPTVAKPTLSTVPPAAKAKQQFAGGAEDDDDEWSRFDD